MSDNFDKLPLGKSVQYQSSYDPALLCPIPRQLARDKLGIDCQPLPFKGGDIWNAYELSWLNTRGLPQVAYGEFIFPCDSPSIVESKSFKLYLNSINQKRFDDVDALKGVLQVDLSACVEAPVGISLLLPNDWPSQQLAQLSGDCLDGIDIAIDHYEPDPQLLVVMQGGIVSEQLHSHLLRSLCPVTGQPDWASIVIEYRGHPIERAGLLKYLVGYRQHQEFHEQCVERIFRDLSQRCRPQQLSVYARFLRRGGIDINPLRCSEGGEIRNSRLFRQ